MVTERDVWAAAKVIAVSPLIDAQRLPAEAWCGLARQILEEVEHMRTIEQRIAALPRLGPRDS
jgi:hypothetical protein